MADIAVINFPEASPLDEKVAVPQEILDLKVDQGLLHEAMRYYRAGQRQGTHATKTRSQVRGGGHKPWKQKHTGRARAGSNRSPLWRKGGITFGPHPRDHSLAYPAKKRALVLTHALASKFPDSIRFVKEENLVEVRKTKELARFCQQLNSANSILLVTSGDKGNLSRASSNLGRVRIKRVRDLSGWDVLASSMCVFGDKAWKEMVEFRYGGV